MMTESDTLGSQHLLVQQLAAALGAQLIETHISWVLVGTRLAYKIKKALHLDFVDFSTLAARHRFCRQELILNRRLASPLYLGVVAITGSPGQPRLGGTGAPIEYAVLMRTFAQQALWSHRLASGQLSAAEAEQLAQLLARLHGQAARALPDSPWGSAAALRRASEHNLAAIAALGGTPAQCRRVAQIQARQAGRHARLAPVYAQRKEQGMVRECHADLHGGNILTRQGRVELFDCLEFSDALRWIDVIDDLAFIWMDLACHGRTDLAMRLLGSYLAITGDYAALELLRVYATERALVRYKISRLREHQGSQAHSEARRRMACALACSRAGRPQLVIMHGLSGSGKSSVAAELSGRIGALVLRSDVERKRADGPDPYAPGQVRHTYARLLALARQVLVAQLPVIIDASFLERAERDRFAALARAQGLPFCLVDVTASMPTMHQRVLARQCRGADPSDAGPAVLAQQFASYEPLGETETACTLRIDTEAGLDPKQLAALAAELRRQGRAGSAPPPAEPV